MVNKVFTITLTKYSTFDAIRYELDFFCTAKTKNAESNFRRFSSVNRPILLQFHVRYSYTNRTIVENSDVYTRFASEQRHYRFKFFHVNLLLINYITLFRTPPVCETVYRLWGPKLLIKHIFWPHIPGFNASFLRFEFCYLSFDCVIFHSASFQCHTHQQRPAIHLCRARRRIFCFAFWHLFLLKNDEKKAEEAKQ